MTRNQELNQAGLSLFHAKPLTPPPEPDIWQPVTAASPAELIVAALRHVEGCGVSVIFCLRARTGDLWDEIRDMLRTFTDDTWRGAPPDLHRAVSARLHIQSIDESHPFAGSRFAPYRVRYFFDPSAVQSILAAHIERWRSA